MIQIIVDNMLFIFVSFANKMWNAGIWRSCIRNWKASCGYWYWTGLHKV